MNQAMRVLVRMARARLVDRAAEHTNMPKPFVRDMTTAAFNAGGNTAYVTFTAGWIALYKLGAVQAATGTYVNTRGEYEGAFIAGMKSGHAGVFKRIAGTQMTSAPESSRKPGQYVKRQKIRELHGANPANAITNNPDLYLEVVAQLIEEHLYPQAERAIDRAFARLTGR
ncbi:hypothetical protein [Rhizobium sp. SL86]|uniref:hypothetical protein n=1 Tax=Rhizobium sp. SL86 TaxID=2995148 RepID=UPI0022743FC8|nr:hypothetical protein [Rhizobium sp. SL86]MCY1664596.1 hypothetical protein [Rhizobium sp. SL86]